MIEFARGCTKLWAHPQPRFASLFSSRPMIRYTRSEMDIAAAPICYLVCISRAKYRRKQAYSFSIPKIGIGMEVKMEPTWKPHEKHGSLTKQSDLPDTVFAFPKQRKEPLTDASHVRNSIARFDQVLDVSDEDRELAYANIKKAADYYGIGMTETDWTQLGKMPRTGRTSKGRRGSARKAAGARKRHAPSAKGARE
jgi:hypothetical protein